MAAILQFQNSNKSERPAFAPGHTAKILLYTGVRFERIDFEALKAQAIEHQLSELTRLAN